METMNNQVQTLKGFRDFTGVEAKKRQWLVEKIRAVFERFGFEPLETPALEYESLLLGKYGSEADKLIFGFEDRGGRRVALRYDQTVPTARVIAQNQNELVLPYKRYQIQPVWRSEKPQKGRYREFLQCDADIVGTASVGADGEILALYFAIYREIGLNNLKIKFNDRNQLLEAIKLAGVPDEQLFPVIQALDKLDKKGENEVVAELKQKGIADDSAQKILKNIQNLSESRELRIIRDIAQKMGVPQDSLIFDPALARGLDYYTGMIFEGYIDGYDGGSVGGGGRYNNLLKDLVAVDLPAVGFGLGFDRTLEAAEQLGKLPTFSSNAKVLVTIFSLELADKSVEVTNMLRKQGINAEVYLDSEKKLEAQLKYASKKNIPYIVVIGPDEIANDSVVIKDMEKNKQEQVKLLEIANYLNKDDSK